MDAAGLRGVRACLTNLEQEAVDLGAVMAAHLIAAAIEDIDQALRRARATRCFVVVEGGAESLIESPDDGVANDG